jgi:hypothetical protein
MFREAEKPTSQIASRKGNDRKLHSIHGLLRGRVVDGEFEAAGGSYRFSFVPSAARVAEGRFSLSGRMVVDSPRLGTRSLDGVEARLIAVQGGVGASPVRRQLLTGTAQTSQTATSEQKMEQERGPETDLQPGLRAFERPRLDESGRPMVEATGTVSFVGVLYFNLSPLDGAALGVPLDLNKVQLNLRLAPTDDLARDLQNIFSDLAATLHGNPPDGSEAAGQVEQINRLLKS